MANIVRETIEDKNIAISAGLVIICNNKILLGHPTNQPWKGSYSIPKGHIEEGEDQIDAAIREIKEEIGVFIDRSQMSKDKGTIVYDRNGKIYKKVHYFVVYLENEPILSKNKLELKEIDHAAFFTKEEAKPLIFRRFLPILTYLK